MVVLGGGAVSDERGTPEGAMSDLALAFPNKLSTTFSNETR